MARFPLFPERTIVELDGVWEFSFLGDIDADRIDVGAIEFDDRMAVPMAFDATPRYAGKRGLTAYRMFVDATPKRVMRLLLGGFGMWLRAFVDGQELGTFPLPYSPVEIVVPPSASRSREIVLLVDNRFDDERSPLQRQYFDFYAYGGLFRSVQVQEVESVWLRRVHVSPLDLDGRVRLTARFGRVPEAGPSEVSIEYAFDSAAGAQHTTALDWEGDEAEVVWECTVPEPRLWSPGTPHLHQVSVVARLGEVESRIVERFGIRHIGTKGKELLLNGQPLRLRGYNRHESHPQVGPALSAAQHLSDLQLLSDMGANCVRGSHYAQDQTFLELCDELGFLVWEESLGWQQNEQQLTDERFVELQVDQTERMVLQSYNHPSVIFWGFLNEGESHLTSTRPAYERLARTIRTLDSSRLVTYATNHIDDDRHLDLVDVVSVNCYPGWYAESDQARPLSEVDSEIERIVKHLDQVAPDKPALISEIGAGALYGFRDSHRAHWSEEYQADLLDRVCTAVLKNHKLAGLLIWQMHDMRTYESSLALFRPRAFNNKGTFDEYRRPKLAHAIVKAHFLSDDAIKPGRPCARSGPCEKEDV